MSRASKILTRTFLAMNIAGGASAAVRTDAMTDGLTAYWSQKVQSPSASDKTALTAMRYGTALLMTGPLMTYADVTGNYDAKVEGLPVRLPRTPDGFTGELLGWQGHGSSTLARLNEDAGAVFSVVYGTASWPGQLVGSVGVVAIKDLAQKLRPN